MHRIALLFMATALSYSSFALSFREMDLSGFWQFSFSRGGEYFNHELMIMRTDNKLDLYDDKDIPYYSVQGIFDLNHRIVGLTTVQLNGVNQLVFIQLKHYVGPENGYRFDDEVMPILEASDDVIKIGDKEGLEFGRMVRIKTIHGPSTAVPHN